MRDSTKLVLAFGVTVTLFSVGVIFSVTLAGIVAGYTGGTITQVAVGWLMFGLALVVTGWVSAR